MGGARQCSTRKIAWDVGRSRAKLAECPDKHFGGHVQCDGYGVYDSYVRSHPEVKLIACLAHIRRGFTDSLKSGPCRDAALIVHMIRQLYHIESELREKKASPTLRYHVRSWQSAPLVRRIGRYLRIMLPKHRPSSPTGKALAYAMNHWAKFERYLEDGRFEIDNNETKNRMRPVKLGMKNPPSPRLRRPGWLFFGSEDAAHHAAAIYTLVENCKLHDLPFEAYLKELLTVLPGATDPEVIASLTPSSIAEACRNKPDQSDVA